jgi:hypothetical protein
MNEPNGRFTQAVRALAATAVLFIVTFAAAEEEQWAKVAAVMRDNATRLNELVVLPDPFQLAHLASSRCQDLGDERSIIGLGPYTLPAP